MYEVQMSMNKLIFRNQFLAYCTNI